MTFSLNHLVIEPAGRSGGQSALSREAPQLDEVRTFAANHSAFADAMRAFYAEVDSDIAARSPVCTNRGHCCRFSEYGHRLYVTDVELAFFADTMRNDRRLTDDQGVCPYQINSRCTARDARPLGCRVFFCDPGADWQGPVYEQYLACLKQLGRRFNIPYRYREWLSALADVTTGDWPARRADR